MKLKNHILLFLIPASIFISCSTPYQIRNIDVLRPAAYTLPSEARTVVLVNNTLPYRSESLHTIRMGLRHQTIDSLYFDRMPALMLKSLREELLNRGYFNRVEIDTISYKSSLVRRGAPADQNMIDNSAIRYGADAVILLDDYTYSTLIKIDQPDFEWYFALLQAESKMLWRFAAVGNKSQGTFEVQKDTLFWSGEDNTPDESVRVLPEYGDALTELARYAGSKFANQITPFWENVARVMFSSGNEYFINAAQWVSKNNWEEASKLWNYIFNNGKTIEKARAAINLALYFEINGTIDQAISWCEKSLAEYQLLKSSRFNNEKNIVTLYLKELNDRDIEIGKLDKQLAQ